jgi:tetratricopeptide (TPR) repeat protein
MGGGSLQKFIGELRRRNVLRVGAAFLIGGWVALQVFDILGPALGLPDWTIIAVAVLIVTGLPISLAVAWFFEITPGGMVPTSEVSISESTTVETGRRIDRIIISLLAAALAFFVGEFVYRSIIDEQYTSKEPLPVALAILPRTMNTEPSGSIELIQQIANEIGRALASLSTLPVTPTEVVENLPSDTTPVEASGRLHARYLLLFDTEQPPKETVHVELFDAQEEQSVWTASFDPASDDALQFQQRVSQQVALEIGVLSATEANRLFSLPTENSEAYGLYLRGMQELTRSSYDARQQNSKAELLFLEALKLDPRFPLAHAAICRIEVSRFQYTNETATFEKAERHCHRALTLSPSSGETHIALGSLYMASGQHERAEESFLAAIGINPSYISALLGLARTYDLLGDAQRAEDTFKQAIRAQPSYYRTYDAIADHYYARGDYDQCRANLLLAAQLAPSDPNVWNDIGTTYLLTGSFQEAEAAFAKALTLNPEEPYALGNLATTYYFQQRFDKARPLYENAARLTPHDSVAWRNLGDVLYYLGEQDGANSAFQQAIEISENLLEVNPQDSQILSSLLVAVASLGDKERFFALVVQLESTVTLYPGAEYDVAVGYCRLRLFEECGAYVLRASEENFPISLLRADPDLQPVSQVLDEI